MGHRLGISKSEVSRICAGLDEVVTALRTRRLDHTNFPYVYLDATYLHVRNPTSQVVSMAVVVATGITADGRHARRMAVRRTPLPVRGLHGPTQPDQRY